jgi:Leucine-rich repeat (LRR) protein
MTFSFGHNKIADVSLASTDIIAQCCRSLTTLEGPNNKLSTLPDLSRCSKLTTINLADNTLQIVPSISNAVIRLNIMNNNVSSISDMFGGNQLGSDTFRSSLVELRLRGNKLGSLDEKVFQCMTSVTMIDAGSNDLKDLPNILGFLPQLRSLQLDGNPIRSIRNPFLNDTSALKNFLRKRGQPPGGEDNSVASTAPLPTNNAAKSLVNSALVGTFTLDLSDKGLNSLPIEVGNELLLSHSSSGREEDNGFVGERIRKLNVSNNEIETLDDWLSAVPNITSLQASKNRIGFLPKFFGDVRLEELIISRNKISSASLAETLQSCNEGPASELATNLKYLDLSGNQLKWMPTALSKLPVLSSLILSNNSITTLASESRDDGTESGFSIEGFNALETLNLSDNKISDLGNLPRCLATNCPAIKYLSLRNNDLTSSLGFIERLTSLDLRGNPQRGIRVNILNRKAADILSYLRDRIDDKDSEAIEAKSSSSNSNDEDKTGPSVIEARERVESLKKRIQDITLQLNNVYITEAQKFDMSKKLQTSKADLIKEERSLRDAMNECS